jgi:hypothetical protein
LLKAAKSSGILYAEKHTEFWWGNTLKRSCLEDIDVRRIILD